jgi:hypothetical protein
MDPWLEAAKSFGVAALVLAAIAFAIYKVSVWVGSEIIIPLRNTVISGLSSFLTNLDTSIRKLEGNVDRIVKVLESHSQTLGSCQKQASHRKQVPQRA